MKKYFISSILLTTFLFGLEVKTIEKPKVEKTKESEEAFYKEELKKSEDLKKKMNNFMADKDSKENILDNLYVDGEGRLFGKKVPKVLKVPEIKTEAVKPEDRKMYVNTYDVERKKKEYEKKSPNIAKLYEFLSLYGMEPRKDGNLPNEKELYKLIESKQVVLKKEVIRAESFKK